MISIDGTKKTGRNSPLGKRSVVVPTILHTQKSSVIKEKKIEHEAVFRLSTTCNHHPAGRPQKMMNSSTFLIMTLAAMANRRLC